MGWVLDYLSFYCWGRGGSVARKRKLIVFLGFGGWFALRVFFWLCGCVFAMGDRELDLGWVG